MFKNSILKIIGALALFTVSITVNVASVDFDVYAKANSTSGSAEHGIDLFSGGFNYRLGRC